MKILSQIQLFFFNKRVDLQGKSDTERECDSDIFHFVLLVYIQKSAVVGVSLDLSQEPGDSSRPPFKIYHQTPNILSIFMKLRCIFPLPLSTSNLCKNFLCCNISFPGYPLTKKFSNFRMQSSWLNSLLNMDWWNICLQFLIVSAWYMYNEIDSLYFWHLPQDSWKPHNSFQLF